MSFETQRPNFSDWSPMLVGLCLAGLLSLIALVCVAAGLEVEPFWFLLPLPALWLLWVVVRKAPVALLVAMVYVGNLKPHAAAGFSFSDPTLIVAALLYLAVALELLQAATGINGRSLSGLLGGQWRGVGAFALLVFVVAVSYLYTPAPLVGGGKVLRLIGFDGLAFLAPLILIKTERDVRLLVLLSIAASLAVAVKTILNVVHPSEEMVLGLRDPTQIGAGMLMGVATLLILYFPSKTGPMFRTLLLGLIAVFAVGTVASLSRGAVIGLLLVVAASSLLLPASASFLSRRALLLGAVGVVVLTAVSLLWASHLPALYSKFAVKSVELDALLQGRMPPAGSAGERFSYADSAIEAFLAKPLLGWGAGGWSSLWHYTYERAPETYPHNFVLEVAAEQGLMGLAALGMLLVAVAGACARIVRSGRLVFAVPVLALCFLSHLTSGSIEDRGLWLWCGVAFAVEVMVRVPERARSVAAQRSAPAAFQQSAWVKS